MDQANAQLLPVTHMCTVRAHIGYKGQLHTPSRAFARSELELTPMDVMDTEELFFRTLARKVFPWSNDR